MTVSQGRPRHVPERSCVACRARKGKWEPVRIVRTAQGQVIVDERGKVSGRGAYLCRRRACWETALKKKRLERALKRQMTASERAQLEAYGQALGSGDGSGERSSGNTTEGAIR